LNVLRVAADVKKTNNVILSSHTMTVLLR